MVTQPSFFLHCGKTEQKSMLGTVVRAAFVIVNFNLPSFEDLVTFFRLFLNSFSLTLIDALDTLLVR